MRQSTLSLFLSLMLILVTGKISAQKTEVSIQEASTLFNQGSYNEALPLLEALLEHYPRGPQTNYYYGISLVKLQKNNPQAIESLKYASLKKVDRDVFFFLGKAYQYAYEFDEAARQYQQFLKYADDNDPLKPFAQIALEDSQNSRKLINKYFQISVLSKDTLPANQILSAYHLSPESGTLTTNQSFFKSGVASNQVMYQTELGNEVLFVLEQPDTALFDIHKMVKLLDKWSQSKDLGEPVNTQYDERYPFLMVDGTTFYFSSDRPGGMGGMDIYQSFYDPQSGSYTQPENMGPPFNSPQNDYLFAADAFENRAWFTTNRGINSQNVVVVEIKWDNTVIKNLARDTEQIRQLAKLPLAADTETRIESEYINQRVIEEEAPKDEDFRFYINDTLLYTRFENFLNPQALNVFKSGLNVKAKKDSLEKTMNHKRKVYSQSYNKDELKQLIDEILVLEKEVYSFSGKAEQHFIQARKLEIEKIRQLKAGGNYHPKKETSPIPIQKPASLLKPENSLFFAENEFTRDGKKLSAMYMQHFHGEDISKLHQADSLYSWANLLKLQAARLLEQGNEPQISQSKLSLLERIKNIDSLNNSEEPERDYAREAQETKDTALSLYHKSLDQKYSIYLPRMTWLINQPGTNNLNDSLATATAYYNEAVQGVDKMYTYNPERYEGLGSLKRKAVHIMENTLVHSTRVDASSDMNITLNSGSIPKSYPALHFQEKDPATSEIQKKSEKASPPGEVVATAFAKSHSPVYKIQIGVFSHEPDSRQLEGLQEISTQPVDGNSLVKYFVGRWNSYQEANLHINTIRESGFKDAFVVAFLNDKIIPLGEARRLNGER